MGRLTDAYRNLHGIATDEKIEPSDRIAAEEVAVEIAGVILRIWVEGNPTKVVREIASTTTNDVQLPSPPPELPLQQNNDNDNNINNWPHQRPEHWKAQQEAFMNISPIERQKFIDKMNNNKENKKEEEKTI
jgi:hypothetical protein